ncbi:dynamin family protein [Brachybacterium sp. AOP25-B2-12]|uniref:dynamin family protein n=1 Tax=Brachybacterium sp. AOP25-B2-12 TaxID=3457710 RepID=UPI0040336059
MMTTAPGGPTTLEDLASDLHQVHLPLPVEGAERGRRAVASALDQLADHVVPRLEALDAPLLVVVGGSTGAGKSSLTNALVGRPVSRAGAIRPTTRRPILVHHPADAAWFTGPRILPGLARVHAEGPGTVGEDARRVASTTAAAVPRDGTHAEEPSAAATSLLLVADPAVPRGLALLDAPDIDSVSAGNRELARQLLRAADLWLFVTTANRYADAVPWEVLRTAAARDITVAVVMNRIPDRPGVAEELSEDLRGLLDRGGLDGARLFLVTEGEVDEDGMLPPDAVASIRGFFTDLAEDTAGRGAIARRTLAGAITGLASSAREISDHAADQDAAREHLRADVDSAFAESRERIDTVLGDGSLLRGEVLARWQDVVGTGELIRGVQSLVGRVRDSITGALSGRPAPAVAAEDALGSGLVHVVVDEVARAAERADAAWRSTEAGRALAADGDLARVPEGFGDDVSAAVRAWQGDVLELVRSEGSDRRIKARVLSLGVNAVGVALMVVVFASTAFIPTGLEVGTGAAAALIGQKLLETIFGEDAVRRLSRIAREALASRLDDLVADRAEPFRARLAEVAGGTGPERLREDAALLDALAADVRAGRGDREDRPDSVDGRASGDRDHDAPEPRSAP